MLALGSFKHADESLRVRPGKPTAMLRHLLSCCLPSCAARRYSARRCLPLPGGHRPGHPASAAVRGRRRTCAATTTMNIARKSSQRLLRHARRCSCRPRRRHPESCRSASMRGIGGRPGRFDPLDAHLHRLDVRGVRPESSATTKRHRTRLFLWSYSRPAAVWLTLTVVIWSLADWLAQLSGRNPLAIRDDRDCVVSAILLATGTSRHLLPSAQLSIPARPTTGHRIPLTELADRPQALRCWRH